VAKKLSAQGFRRFAQTIVADIGKLRRERLNLGYPPSERPCASLEASSKPGICFDHGAVDYA
jgi:hypothetical protein